MIGDELRLAQQTTGDDFEIPRHSADADITASNHWTKVSTNGIAIIRDDLGGSNQYVEYRQYNVGGTWSFDDFGAAESDVELLGRVRFDDATNGLAGICARLTGTGSSLRGYVVTIGPGSIWMQLKRFTGGGGGGDTFGIWSGNLGFTPEVDKWYWIRYRITGSNHLGRCWEDGDVEPAGWQLGRNDSTHAGPGSVGIHFKNGTANPYQYLDDFATVPIPSVYETTGDWISDILPLTSVDRYSSSRISWEETTPTDTTVLVETRIDGGSWDPATSGAEIPGLVYDDFLAGVELETRITLSTTDDTATPAVENLRIFFDPLEFADLEILVDSLSATVANGRLETYGKNTPAGNDYGDLVAEAALLGWHRTPARGLISAELKYNGVSIDSISFSGDPIPVAGSVGPWNYYSLPALPLESSPTDNLHQWTAGDHDTQSSQIFEWVLIDKGIAIRADAYYYVGHPTIVDLPSSIIAAIAALDDHPGSILAEGYNLDDSPSSSLAQARRRDDFPASILPAVRAIDDFLGSTVVAIAEIRDEPSSLLVFAVNRENVIEVHVIAESTFAALGGEGISWN